MSLHVTLKARGASTQFSVQVRPASSRDRRRGRRDRAGDLVRPVGGAALAAAVAGQPVELLEVGEEDVAGRLTVLEIALST